MRLLVLILFSLSFFEFFSCEDDQFKNELKSFLEKFVKIVEENEMNVTIISSELEFWSNKEVKVVKEFSVDLPPNNAQLTDSKITEEKIQDWIKTITDLADPAGFAGGSRIAHIKDGKTEKIDRFPATKDKGFETKLYKTVTSVRNGGQSYVTDNPSYVNYYQIRIPRGDGKEENIEIIAGDLETEVVKKSDSITEEEVKAIEKKLKDAFFKLDSEGLMGQVLRHHMNSNFKDDHWQVIMDPGDDIFVPSKKFAVVKAANTEALVYSL